jgi:hypothetical protein
MAALPNRRRMPGTSSETVTVNEALLMAEQQAVTV